MSNRVNSIGAVRAWITVLAIVVVVASSIFGIYSWQHDKLNNLNGQVAGLNSQIFGLNSQINTLKSQLKGGCQSTNVCQNYYYSSQKGVKILIYSPLKDAKIVSPVAVIGQVPGNWSFEAEFPVHLKDDKGNKVAQTSAHLLGSWQTDQLVPFSVQLTYSSKPSGSGTLVLQKDNPSGLDKNSDSLVLPVVF